MLRAAIVVLLSIGVLAIAGGCGGTVSGQVSSKSAQSPVPSATVVVGDQQAVTDSAGRYTIDKASTGSATVTVQAQGFGPYEGSLEVQRGENSLDVALENGTVTGVLTENAVAPKPITSATVTIAGDLLSNTDGKRFEIANVPVGEQTVVVECKKHAVAKQTITVEPGPNEVKVALNLSPEETYMRYYSAYRFGRYREAYRMVHPDVRKHYSYAAFAKDMKQGGEVLSIKFYGTKMLSKWRPAYLKKTYRQVAAIDRAVKEQTVFGSYTDNYTQHWVEIDGRWYIVFDWRT